jgi:hypothetical protein
MTELPYLTSIHGRRLGLAADDSLVLNPRGGVPTVLGRVAQATITSAQLLALNATARAIVPAPGAGLAIIPRLIAIHKPAGTAYDGIAAGEDLVAKYTNKDGAACSGVIETTGFLDQTTAQTRVVGMPGASGTTSTATITPVANAVVVLHLLDG